jgi:hemerythrin-like domain-containing protein
VKRHPALLRLSHDHHDVLAQAVWLRRSIVGDAERLRTHFLAFWDEQAERHFALEEELLVPPCRRLGADLAALAERMLAEHAELRTAVARIEAGESVDLAALHALGDRLKRHVRFEERELFPALEAALDERELRTIGKRLGS